MAEYQPETHLVTYSIEDAPEGVKLPRDGAELHLLITNLRNRPLMRCRLTTLASSILGLYKRLVTGCNDFPFLVCYGDIQSRLLTTPFEGETLTENTRPSPLTEAPPGLKVPPASPSSPDRALLLPRHPEKANIMQLKANQRNCVRVQFFRFEIFFRVLSPVYRTDYTERPNRWRISDYDRDGNMLMSILCQFKQSAEEREAISAKRKRPEDESSSSPLQSKKRLRL